jgi:5-methylcytosine-specific restriction endonuclease McrA
MPKNKEKECDNCKSIFTIKYPRQRFCSQKCSSYWLSNVRNKGVNHPRYKGNVKKRFYYPSIFYKIRKRIIDEFNGKCLICNNSASSVHHLDYDKGNNNYENLVLLCNSCHAKTNTNRDEWEERIRHLTGCW